MKRIIPLWLIATLCLTIANTAYSQGESDRPGVLPIEDLRTFTKIYNIIREDYVEEVSDSTLLEYAVKGMLSELDPHSAYLDSSSYEELQVNTTGEFGGLGIEIGTENDLIKIISPIDDTPASRAGLMAGDLIIELDGKPVSGVGVNNAIKMMRGPIGSEIDLTIIRQGEDKPIAVTLTRDTIKVASVRARMMEPGFGYLRISQFQVGTGADVVKQLQKLQQQAPLQGLVLDLRNNPGGVLEASVEVVDAFLDSGKVVYTQGRASNSEISYNANPGDELDGAPLVVLINGGSASASEIVAGALQDHRRAVIVGTDSFGKGSVQTVVPITEKQAIKLTTALYYTPLGRSIQAQGIEPDIFVERAQLTTVRDTGFTTEADLDNHLDNGNGGKENNKNDRKTNNGSRDNLLERDNQLYEAINLLKGASLFAQQNGTPATNVATLKPEDSKER